MTDVTSPPPPGADDLLEADRRRVLEEEEYRAAVRKRLEHDKPTRSRFVEFLNSSFALWLLSAIFLSGTGTVYSCWQKDRDVSKAQHEKDLEAEKIQLQKMADEARDNKATVERLDLEISYRFSQVLLSLRSISEQGARLGSPDSNQRKLQIAGPSMGVMQGLAQKPRADQPPLYPDYAAYALPTLISELRRRVPVSDRSAIERSLANCSARVPVNSSRPMTQHAKQQVAF